MNRVACRFARFFGARRNPSPYTQEAMPLHHAVIYLDANDLERILVGGAAVELQDERGHTALHVAAKIHRPKHARRLLDHKANPNATNKQGDTPTHLAAVDPVGTETLRLLIGAGADVNAQNWWGATPLHRAIEQRNIAAIRILIWAGASLWVEDDVGRTPRSMVEESLDLIEALAGVTQWPALDNLD